MALKQLTDARTGKPVVVDVPRRRGGKKKGKGKGGSKRKTIALATLAADINAVAQFLEPFITGGTLAAIETGDVRAIVGAIQNDAKAALAWRNIVEALGPSVSIRILKAVLRGAGIGAGPKIGKFRLL
jgi:hypothetical protein